MTVIEEQGQEREGAITEKEGLIMLVTFLSLKRSALHIYKVLMLPFTV